MLARCGAIVRRAPEPPPADGALAGVFLIVSTVADEQAALALRALADRHRCLLYCENRPVLSDLALPAVVWRGPLTVAVATGGASPALARRLREDLESILDDRLVDLVARLAALREQPAEGRSERLREAVAGVRVEGVLKLPP